MEAHLKHEDLAAWLDGTLPPAARDAVEVHLAGCAACRDEVYALRRLLRQRPRWAVPAAAVSAVAAAAVVLFALWPAELPVAPDAWRGTGADGGQVAPMRAIRPVGGTMVRGRPMLVWHSAGPGAHYRVAVTGVDGASLWMATLRDTVALLPDSVTVPAGSTVFWFVDALLEDGRRLTTGAQRFTVAP